MNHAIGWVVRVVALVALWLLAWGDASLSRITTGTILAVALLLAFPSERRDVAPLRVRPLAVARLIGYILGQLVVSNVLVAREILTPGSKVKTGVLAHPLDDASDEVISLIANIIAVTPGTMTVETTLDPNVLYVHFLLLDDVDKARRSIDRLEALVSAAIRQPDQDAPAEEVDS